MHCDIPNEIRQDPIILEMETLAVDLIVIANVRCPSYLITRWEAKC